MGGFHQHVEVAEIEQRTLLGFDAAPGEIDADPLDAILCHALEILGLQFITREVDVIGDQSPLEVRRNSPGGGAGRCGVARRDDAPAKQTGHER